MHFLPLLLTLSSFSSVVTSVPFKLQNGSLQNSRRRAVDYPMHPRMPRQRAQKRSVPYSVVQVDGSTQSVGPAATTIVETVAPVTVIQTAVPSTQIVVYTTTVTGEKSEQTVVVTKTKKIFVAPTHTSEETATMVKTVLVTPTPATTTKYYDNGMWHTSYAVKNWSTWQDLSPTVVVASSVKSSAAPSGTDPYAYEGPYKYDGAAKLKRLVKKSAIPDTELVEDVEGVLTRTEMRGVKRFMR